MYQNLNNSDLLAEQFLVVGFFFHSRIFSNFSSMLFITHGIRISGKKNPGWFPNIIFASTGEYKCLRVFISKTKPSVNHFWSEPTSQSQEKPKGKHRL